MKKIMGLDLGKKRIGVALSDALLISAHPYKTCTIKYRNIPSALNEIIPLIDEFNIDDLVIGNPLHLSGEASDMSNFVHEFIVELKKIRTEINIHLIDERFTSITANQALREFNIGHARQKEIIDSMSASIILDQYLNQLRIAKEREEKEDEQERNNDGK